MEAPLYQRLCTASSLQWNSLTRMITGLYTVLIFVHTIVVHLLLFWKFLFHFLPVFRILFRIGAGLQLGLWIRIRFRISGFWSRQGKMSYKKRKKLRNFMFRCAVPYLMQGFRSALIKCRSETAFFLIADHDPDLDSQPGLFCLVNLDLIFFLF